MARRRVDPESAERPALTVVSRRHREAVELTVKAHAFDDRDAALVEFVLDLADQVDAAGEVGPGSRLAATYMTALRTLLAQLRERKPERPAPSGRKVTKKSTKREDDPSDEQRKPVRKTRTPRTPRS